ncbi:MAG: hypothetical protein ABI769_01345, partial [Pseudomonadota bacterium]
MAAASTGEALELLATSLARARGDNFFPELAAHLALVLDAVEALVCEAAPNKRARTLGVWRSGATVANYEYDVDRTPCAVVQAGEVVAIDLASRAYPNAFRKSGGYFGMPLAANDGAVLGHLCVYTDAPVIFSPDSRAVCDIIANRAAAELRLV